jgi:hypothetical protein
MVFTFLSTYTEVPVNMPKAQKHQTKPEVTAERRVTRSKGQLLPSEQPDLSQVNRNTRVT